MMWVNGELVDSSFPAISAHDHGLLLGDGVFDTLIVRDGTPVFLERHLRRLRAGINRLAITPTPTDSEITAGIHQLIDVNNFENARVRITVTPGPGASPRERGARPLTLIALSPLAEAPASVSLCTVEWTRNERSPLAGIKSTSWGDNALILRHAQQLGFNNAVLCDTTGRLSECTTSNLFLVIDQRIVTPSLDSGCLPGILREVLLEAELATEGDLTPAELDRASEAFITSSTTGIVPVHRVDSRDYAVNGPLTTFARSRLFELEGEEEASR